MSTGKRQNRISGNSTKSRLVMKTRLPDKQSIEGVYKNVALTHSMTSLVGSVVSVQVKNGKVYEGILKTFSPKMDIVLSAAHLIEDVGSKGDSLPTQDTLIDHLIFPGDHVVYMSAISVDLTYGEQNSFTDGAISRSNGHGTEKDLKELQPWQGDVELEDMRLDDSSGSGWTAEEMFKRNELSFNVKSVYSDDLEQYTTPLQKGDSAEWQEREKKAEKIAAEIESSDQSQRRYEAENEDCMDEEEKFSAVVRPGRHHAPAPTIQFGTATSGMNSNASRYIAPHYRDRGINQNHGRPYRIPDPADSAKANGKLDDKKTPVGPAEPRQLKAPSSESLTFTSPTGKPDSKVNVSPSTAKEEARKLKEFKENFKLAETSRPTTKPTVPVDEADVKPSAAASTASAPPPVAIAAPAATSNAAALPSDVILSSAICMPPAAGSGTGTVPASNAPGASVAPSAGTPVNESSEPGLQTADREAEKQENDAPKVVSSLNPNAPAFQPRQQVPSSPQPAGYISAPTPTHNPPRNNKKATVSMRGNGPHHQGQMTDPVTAAHVQAATGPPFITNQYPASYLNYSSYSPSFPVLPLTPRSSQEMGQGQHFAYGMPQGVMQSHMPYGGQGAQQILQQSNGMHVQPQPTPPPPQGGGGVSIPGSPANPQQQQVMQHGGIAAAAAASQQQPAPQPPAALAAQGVMPQQQQYGGYQGQPSAAAVLGHPSLQPSPQSSAAASPLAAAPVAYAGGQYYQYHQPIAYGGMPGQSPHGSMHHQAMQQPVMFYQMSGQQHQHHQQLFHAPMQGLPMMGAATPGGQGGSHMYMQQQIAAVHHQIQSSYQQQQQP